MTDSQNKELQKLYRYDFIIEPFHVDFRGFVNLSQICNYMLYAAENHATILGCGLPDMLAKGLSWFLTRAVIEVDTYPKQYQKGYIETWVEQSNRMFSIRNLEFFDETGKPFAGMRLMWALVDLHKHTPVDLAVIPHLTECALPNRISTVQKPVKIPEVSDACLAAPPARLYDVSYSDIDINQHFNSVKYIERIVDLFPLDLYRAKHITRLEINYAAEAVFGTKLAIYTEPTKDENVWAVSMRDTVNGEHICRARVTWKNN